MYRIYRFMYGLVGFSRSQTNGFLLFLPLVFLIVISEPLYRKWKWSQRTVSAGDKARLDSLVAHLTARTAGTADTVAQSVSREPLVSFDPNTAAEEFIRRIFRNHRAGENLLRFRAKGGRFFVKSDLLKIYGMDSTLYREVYDFILLPEQRKKNYPAFGKSRPARPDSEFPPAQRTKTQRLDINTADTAALNKVYGVGPRLASRIVKFRDALGGFIHMKQLFEVYRIDSAVCRDIESRFFIATDFTPRYLELNSIGRVELSTHPYLSRKAADAIVAYRNRHGKFLRIEDLEKIPAVDSVMLRKLRPYVRINE